MCGIIGFVGKEQAAPILLDGLARMEYRGYDSAGIAVRGENGNLQVKKAKGRLSVLSELLHDGRDLNGTLGIGHTRWATHGEPNDANAHPHVSASGNIALVHNGIIENYMEIKDALLTKGVKFTSDTDSEVAAQLLEFYYNECHNMLEAVSRTLHRIEGSYAFGILCSDFPDALIAARKDSPLILGYGKGFNFIASDVTAMIRHTREVSYMEDGEIAVVSADSIEVFNSELVPAEKTRQTVDWDVTAAEKCGHPHFMYKEILEQPEVVRKTISPRVKENRVIMPELTCISPDYYKTLSRVYIVACGSSYHVGMVSKYIWEKLLRIPVEVVLGSEFRYCDPLAGPETLVIVISQSGETLDTMAAMSEAKRRGAKTISIVNVVGSSIARNADHVLYTWAGPEIAVATTKAYSTQLVLMDLLGLYLADLLGTVNPAEYNEILGAVQALPEKMKTVLAQTKDIQYFASRYFNHNSIFFIGRNLDYAMGLEGSLKLKEISYIHSEAYASGELKHGTISLIEPGALVVALGTYAPLFDKTVSNIVEVKARGAEVMALTTESRKEKMGKIADAIIVVPDTHPALLPSLSVVPLQLFAYYVALQRGCDIDKPRNLAKSVTVE
ncbi:MAG TPA: glutamine--fructose-6-phosphate transaminase (isomerizing) [Oscillospiraceae bacterium]|nr:glutamine--fructose-6-phosphate transaminase (isomerizing) [Oscillospiraceae bacterium]HPF56241.1 glutamine--fructose-6-phosphate transaminase (isomerizing) [Clostridiales bacterium]HPK35534.1 glutamine--fructose-6-phosphate transaminase (isomerizing) [Oscillospiraceae bacterium]HPR75669.1 glutamine--fructose-6-phosphate transaminase (isomerizing) [Oscillospiraceae bacterium]